jgi:HK97 family phage major capsid protein
MTEGLGSEGGFLVPEELAAEQFDAAIEESVFVPRCRVYGMTTDSKAVAGIEANGSATYGPYGTWEPSWVAEGATIPASTPTLRKVTITARKLGLYISVSNELLADGLSFTQQLGASMKKALAWALDHAVANGNGTGKPIGIVNSSATIEVA